MALPNLGARFALQRICLNELGNISYDKTTLKYAWKAMMFCNESLNYMFYLSTIGIGIWSFVATKRKRKRKKDFGCKMKSYTLQELSKNLICIKHGNPKA